MTSPSHGIELRHLRYFVAVSEQLHFGRAAERLFMAQPPLSHAIRKLEEELGVQLLDRTARQVTLTEAGSVFAAEARNVLASVDGAVAQTRLVGGADEPLRIGCVPHLPIERLQQFLAELRKRDPRFPRVIQCAEAEQVQLLLGGELDLGILTAAVTSYPELKTEPLFPGEPLAALLPRDHSLAKRHVLSPGDLDDEELVLPPRAQHPALHDWLRAAIQDAGYRFRAVHEAAGSTARDLLLAVVAGEGIALSPRTPEEGDATAPIVVWRQLDPPLSMPDTDIAWHARAPRPLQTKLEAARTVARELRAAALKRDD
jgi:DNA-binding transcriptional LysR family regulator